MTLLHSLLSYALGAVEGLRLHRHYGADALNYRGPRCVQAEEAVARFLDALGKHRESILLDWQPAHELPDDGVTVLVGLIGEADAEAAYMEHGQWFRACDSAPLEGVYIWAPWPAVPEQPSAREGRAAR